MLHRIFEEEQYCEHVSTTIRILQHIVITYLYWVYRMLYLYRNHNCIITLAFECTFIDVGWMFKTKRISRTNEYLK